MAQSGAIDTTFGSFMTGTDSDVINMIRQPDGKILVGGSFFKGITRLNTDGTLDISFNPGMGLIVQ